MTTFTSSLCLFLALSLSINAFSTPHHLPRNIRSLQSPAVVPTNSQLTPSSATNDQISPAIANLTNGNYAIVWNGAGPIVNDTPSLIVYGQIYSPSGSAVSDLLTLYSGPNNWFTDNTAEIFGLQNGGFAVGTLLTDPNYEISTIFQFFDENGNPTGSMNFLNLVTDGLHTVVGDQLTNGELAFAYTSFVGDDYVTYVELCTVQPQQTPQCTTQNLAQNNASAYFPLSLNALNNGGFVSTFWNISNDWDWIAFETFNAIAMPIGFTNLTESPCFPDNLRIEITEGLVLENGNVVIIAYDQYGGAVFGGVFNVAGDNIGDCIDITNELYIGDPSIAAFGNSEFVVVWNEEAQTVTMEYYSYLVWGQMYSSGGSTIGSRFLVNQESLNHSTNIMPYVESLSDGDIVVAWASNCQFASTDPSSPCQIYGQVFNASGYPLNSFNPNPVMNSNGGSILQGVVTTLVLILGFMMI